MYNVHTGLNQKKRSVLMYYIYNSILNIDSTNIGTIYTKRHYHLPYVVY